MTKDIFFIHIPKTGGMSVTNLFYIKLNMKFGYYYYIKNKEYLGDSKSLELLDKNYLFLYNKISKWHIPFSFFNKKYQNELLNKFKLFAIVRNPYDRIISIYGYGIKVYNKNKNKSIKELREIYNNSFEINPKKLNEFINTVLGNDKYKYSMDGHIIPMYKHTHINIDTKLTLICEILKYENLNNELNEFIENNNINLPKDSLLKVYLNKSGIELTRKHLDNKSIKLIQEYYKKDFELFGYDINDY